MALAVSIPSDIETIVSEVIIVEPGDYLAIGQVTFDAGGTGRRNIVIRINGNPVAGSSDHIPGAGGICFINASALSYALSGNRLLPGDIVTVTAYQTDGVALLTTANASYIALAKLR